MNYKIKNIAKNTLTFNIDHLNKSAASDLFMKRKSIYDITVNELASSYRSMAVLGGADGYSVLFVYEGKTKVFTYNAK
jgi:hypothetical protein